MNFSDEIDDNLIGKVVYTNSIESNIRNTMLREDYETVKLDFSVDTVLKLPNKHYLTQDKDQKVRICDENFKVVKDIVEINDKKIKSNGIAINEDNEIYISDSENKQIIQMNAQYELINKFAFTALNNLKPTRISYNAGLLYICDSGSSTIQVLNKQLEYVKSIYRDYEDSLYMPDLVIATNYSICIRHYDTIEFLDPQTEDVRCKYENGVCSLVEINNYFYQYVNKFEKVYSYDKYGSFLQTFCLHRFNNFESYANLSLVSGQLMISCGKSLIKFKKNEKNDIFQFKRHNYEIKMLKDRFFGIAVLQNGHLLIGRKYELEIYDQNFKLIKCFSKMNNKKNIKPYDVLVNEKNKIYYIDRRIKGIYLFDMNFKQINYTNSEQRFTSICYKNNYLYASYGQNSKIIIYDCDLKAVKTVTLSFVPEFIRVTNEALCAYADDHIHFCDLITFTVRYKFNYERPCQLFEINSNIYVINKKLQNIYCHDSNGLPIMQQRLNESCLNANMIAFYNIKNKLTFLLFEVKETSEGDTSDEFDDDFEIGWYQD